MSAPGEPTPEAVVRTAVDVFLAHPGRNQATVLSALEAAGLPPEQAWVVYQLVPTAFCRVALRHSRVGFLTTYFSQNPDAGERTALEFATQPTYAAAVRVAEERIAGGLVQQQLLPIVGYSAEYNAIVNLARSGSRLTDVRLVEPVLFEYRSR